MKTSVGILFPIYKQEPSDIEIRRLTITLAKNKDVPAVAIHPRGLNPKNYSFMGKNTQFLAIDDVNFRSRDHYNRMMITLEIYDLLGALFESIVVCQTDAFLIKNVMELQERGYDYIGATWNPPYEISKVFGKLLINRPGFSHIFPSRKIHVGNGGLSFRRIEVIKKIINDLAKTKHWSSMTSITNRKMNEDLALSFFALEYGARIPSPEVANSIFIETKEIEWSKVSSIFGFHALQRCNPALEIRILDSFSSEIID